MDDRPENEDPRANDLMIVEVLKPFTAMNACYSPASGDQPGDVAAFPRKHAEHQQKKGLSRILGLKPPKEGAASSKGKRVAA